MVCYTVPLIAAVAHFITRRSVSSWKENANHLWLSLLLTGGAIFGVVDHWWNGELFLIGENIGMDLLLGVVITIAIVAVWVIACMINKTKSNKPLQG
jgi:hypothetical protein